MLVKALKNVQSKWRRFLKHQTQSESGGNGGGKGVRNDGCCLRGVLEISPDRRASPKTMGHNVLNGHIVIKSICGPRSTKGMEPMANRGDVPEGEDLF